MDPFDIGDECAQTAHIFSQKTGADQQVKMVLGNAMESLKNSRKLVSKKALT